MVRKIKHKKILPLLVLLVLALLTGGIFYWQMSLSPVNPLDTNTQTFVVNNGESLRTIAKNLENKKLIRNGLVFILQVKILGVEKQIQAGEFKLSPSYTQDKIINSLQHGTFDTWILIPEGWRNAEIATLLQDQLGIMQNDFLQIAQEGYMFPSKYSVPRNASASFVANIMRQNFDKQIVSINSQALTPNKKFSGLTLSEIVTLASLVEREAQHPVDRSIVAGILIKRLQNDWPLEVDATLQYALGYSAAEKNWWRKNLTADDLLLNSPFNTRKFKGLPPGPICNPGLASLQAVFNPQESPYWFYLSDKNGNMHYAKTIEEHTANSKKYL